MNKVIKSVAFLLIASLTAVLIALWTSRRAKPPSDAEMGKLFSEHRRDYERLTEMLREDAGIAIVTRDFIGRTDTRQWPRPESEWGITRRRWGEYRELFRKAGVRDGAVRDAASGETMLLAWTWGQPVPIIIKSFVRCDPPQPGFQYQLPPCIEGQPGGMKDEGVRGHRYRRLDEGWYLFEEHE